LAKQVSDGGAFEGVHATIRRQIAQAEKTGIRCQLEDLKPESYNLMLESQTRLGGHPTHTYAELEKILSLFPGCILSFSTRAADKLLAGIIAIKANSKVLNAFYIFDNTLSREMKGMQATYWHVMLWAAENGFEYVDFGPATFGLRPHVSLIRYKEKFGALPYIRRTYVKDMCMNRGRII